MCKTDPVFQVPKVPYSLVRQWPDWTVAVMMGMREHFLMRIPMIHEVEMGAKRPAVCATGLAPWKEKDEIDIQ